MRFPPGRTEGRLAQSGRTVYARRKVYAIASRWRTISARNNNSFRMRYGAHMVANYVYQSRRRSTLVAHKCKVVPNFNSVFALRPAFLEVHAIWRKVHKMTLTPLNITKMKVPIMYILPVPSTSSKFQSVSLNGQPSSFKPR